MGFYGQLNVPRKVRTRSIYYILHLHRYNVYISAWDWEGGAGCAFIEVDCSFIVNVSRQVGPFWRVVCCFYTFPFCLRITGRMMEGVKIEQNGIEMEEMVLQSKVLHNVMGQAAGVSI